MSTVSSTFSTRDVSYYCDICDLTCSSLRSYQRHRSSVLHSSRIGQPASQVVCNKCGASFTRQSGLNRHEALGRCPNGPDRSTHAHSPTTPHADKLKSHECSTCGRRFMFPKDVARHQLIHQKNVSTFPCPICAREFRRKDNLSRHVNATHGGVKKDAPGRSFSPEIRDRDVDTPSEDSHVGPIHDSEVPERQEFFIPTNAEFRDFGPANRPLRQESGMQPWKPPDTEQVNSITNYGNGSSNSAPPFSTVPPISISNVEGFTLPPVSPFRPISISDAKAVSSQKRREELLNSLIFDQMDSGRAQIKPAYSTTCAWITNTQAYIDWDNAEEFEQHCGLLWIKGKPGAGKSTLIKFMYAQASKSLGNGDLLLSHFFNGRGNDMEKSTLGLYRSALFQILETTGDVLEILDTVPSTFRPGFSAWSPELLHELFTSAVERLGQRRTKFFVDALDECDEQEIRDMILHFEDLGYTSKGHFQICFTTRHYPTIVIHHGAQLVLEDESGHHEDLAMYLRRHLLAANGRSLDDLRVQVLQKANGVFIWAVLVTNILNDEFRRGSTFVVERRLGEIPTYMSDLFQQILARDRQGMDRLLLCLQWILFAKEPLNYKELYYALVVGLSVEVDSWLTNGWDPELVPRDGMKRFVLDCSKGLAEITRTKTSMVHFIHESVRDFLIHDGGLYSLWPECQGSFEGLSHGQLSKCCQKYLTIVGKEYIAPRTKVSEASFPEALELHVSLSRKFPFLRYAVKQVFYHANEAAKEAAEDDFLTRFDFKNWILVANLLQQYEIRPHTEDAPLLYVLAEHNSARLIKRFYQLKMTAPWTSRERYRHPLFVALATKHWDALRAILEPCNDPRLDEGIEFLEAQQHVSVERHISPLHWALERDYKPLAEMIVILMDTHVSWTAGICRTPISEAAESGQTAVVQRLLSEAPTDLELTTALFLAVRQGHKEIVTLLLSSSVDFDA